MLRFIKTIILAAVIVGGLWALANRDRLEPPGNASAAVGDASAAVGSQVRSFLQSAFAGLVTEGGPIEASEEQGRLGGEPVIRIASFRLNRFGARLEDREVLPLLVEICRRYDVIALQNLHPADDTWLELLAEHLGQVKPNADYAFVSDLGENPELESQNAILFNRHTVELDERRWYVVDDPDRLLHRRPLVGWFRTQVQERDRAFTFTLANVELTDEISLLGELFRAIGNDGRNEDDIILAGSFSRSDIEPGSGFQRSALTWIVTGTPTDVRQTGQFDNLVFYRNATTEHNGRGGVFDFMRAFNLRLAEAETLSHHLPVWAEFSVFE